MALFVLSGDTGIGKTSYLFNLLLNRPGVGGFLSPLFDHKRNFYLIRTGQRILMQTEIDDESMIWKIGKYRFSRHSFDKAAGTLLSDWSFEIPLCLLDEYGPLEINNSGLMPHVNSVIDDASHSGNQDLLAVVRTSILPNFIARYKVKNVFDLHSVESFFENY